MTRPVVAVCLHDGFYGCGTGAGRSNRAFLDVLTRHLPSDVDLLVLPVHIAESSPEHNTAWHRDTVQILSRVSARVVPLDNGTAGRTRWGEGLTSFRRLVANTARALTEQVSTAPRRLIVAHDVPFFGLPTLLPDDLLRDLVLVPRSTAGIHTPENREQVAWEKYGLAVGANGGVRIAAISRYMRHHLVHDYGLPNSAFVDLQIGLMPDDWTRTPPADLLPEAAHGGFWLAMGRAVPYKGFDDLLDALVLLRQNGHRPPHLVLAAVSNKTEPTSYQQQLAAQIERNRLDVSLITRFDPHIADLLAHPALCGVIMPSRAEPFGRIPIEAYAAGAAPVIATAVGGLTEQITHGKTGFICPASNPIALANSLVAAMEMPSEHRNRMREASQSIAIEHYDYEGSALDFLATVAPWLLGSGQSDPATADLTRGTPTEPGPAPIDHIRDVRRQSRR